MELNDFSPSGLINQWTLVDGHPRCVENPLPQFDAGALAALQTNAAVRMLVGKAEAYEAAKRLVAQYAGEGAEQPEPTLTTTGMDGEETTVANPAYVALEDAKTLVEGADDATLALVALRSSQEPDYTPDDDASANPARAAWDANKATLTAELARLAAQPLAVDPRPVPEKVAMWRAKAVLHADGLLEAADAAISAASNPALSAFWSGGAEIYRASPSLASLAVGVLHLTDAQVDDLFRRAAALPAI